MMSVLELNKLSRIVIGAAIEVHKHLGPGLLESAYEQCLVWELRQQGILVRQQMLIPLVYKQLSIKTDTNWTCWFSEN
jgi:GxxExxY protein